jgi:hypothetical protein
MGPIPTKNGAKTGQPDCRYCRFCVPYSYIMGRSWRTDNHCTRQVVSFPEPCEMFEREPGADDE